MFAVIETNGATHIAIHIPHQGAEKSLPALAAMLEKNAIFINSGWSEFSLVNPSMSIVLGDFYKMDRNGQELAISASPNVLDESFVAASADVFTSNAKGLKSAQEENLRLRKEIDSLKYQLEQANGRIEAMKEQSTETQ
jgi:hypothetical protein